MKLCRLLCSVKIANERLLPQFETAMQCSDRRTAHRIATARPASDVHLLFSEYIKNQSDVIRHEGRQVQQKRRWRTAFDTCTFRYMHGVTLALFRYCRHAGGIIRCSSVASQTRVRLQTVGCVHLYGITPHKTVCSVYNEFATLHCCNAVYLQHGGSNYCGQNDVSVTS